MTTTMTPQHELARYKANARRSRNAEILADLRCSDTTEALRRAVALVADPDADAAVIKVRQLLAAVHRRGDVWAMRVLAHASVSGEQRLGRLTPRQRQRLAEALPLPLPQLRRPQNGTPIVIVTAELAVTPERIAAARRALAPYVASPVLHAAAEAALNAAANVRADQ